VIVFEFELTYSDGIMVYNHVQTELQPLHYAWLAAAMEATKNEYKCLHKITLKSITYGAFSGKEEKVLTFGLD